MMRLLLLPVVCGALCLGCGKSGEDEANQNVPTADGGAGPASGGQNATPAANTTAGAAGRAASPAARSSNPVTSFFQGLDRAAKGAGTGVGR